MHANYQGLDYATKSIILLDYGLRLLVYNAGILWKCYANLKQIASKIVDMGFHKKCVIERMPLLRLSHKAYRLFLTVRHLSEN